ncbi:hypothetical protein HHK36_022264 [Tetracentron sinense]|uniref:Protein kinase domain-containing protein n=1 Tax=Tetracentron sinense TaxID=13715 RepID=A0A835D9F6_TETSI|nr:hypothetical protein HHK36_022264 [Tetracentron sinense]
MEEELSPSKKHQLLSWESRLRIATEIADAVTYLHNGTSKPIIHRAINCRNILLDQHYVAKLFEFVLSKLIPLGQTHVDADLSSWYYGSVAPESKRIGRFTEKSDVYSFGVLLFEILTGKRVFNILKDVYGVRVIGQVENSWQEPNSEVLMAEDNEEDIRVYLNANILKGNTVQLMACAELTMRCVQMNPEERPSMIEAAKELRRIRRILGESKDRNGEYDISKEVNPRMPKLDETEVNNIEKNKRLYLEVNIVKGNTGQLMACAELAMSMRENLEERRWMMEAAKELRRIRMF